MGDGEQVQIWKDKWLHNPSTYRVVTPENLGLQVTRVCELIYGDQMEWKEHLVCQVFLPQDVDAILSIPLSTHGARDRLIWAESKNGKFMVKSAYRLAQDISTERNLPESSNPAALKQVWRDLWNMRVLNMIKHFARRACRDILAIKENLWKRCITKDNLCESCGKELEFACHIFWLCDSAKEVWSSNKLILPIEINSSWKFIDALWKLQQWSNSCLDLVERTIMLCWGICKYRNERRHGGVRRNGLAIIRSSLRLLDEF